MLSIASTPVDDIPPPIARILPPQRLLEQALRPAPTLPVELGPGHARLVGEPPRVHAYQRSRPVLVHIDDPSPPAGTSRHGAVVKPVVGIPRHAVDDRVLHGAVAQGGIPVGAVPYGEDEFVGDVGVEVYWHAGYVVIETAGEAGLIPLGVGVGIIDHSVECVVPLDVLRKGPGTPTLRHDREAQVPTPVKIVRAVKVALVPPRANLIRYEYRLRRELLQYVRIGAVRRGHDHRPSVAPVGRLSPGTVAYDDAGAHERLTGVVEFE
mmetsp:Transcript_6391/g.15922  ORF Transcript_6391/g.15922 Transcript_6391/m.15922 type:complete len:266 (+) Transcript_6391:106-903(+)